MIQEYDLIVVGGGAAGFFAALCAKESAPAQSVLLLEKSRELLTKVRISGGGRCNVTHNCFEAKRLIENYPRGAKELLAPFMRFGPRETIKWFEDRGVKLKTEKDGRLFPVTDKSATIIDCLLTSARQLEVEIETRAWVKNLIQDDGRFVLSVQDKLYTAKSLILTTGGNSDGLAWARDLGHEIAPPVPSLFTFNIPSLPYKEISGVSVKKVVLSLKAFGLQETGPLLITHFGMSGPAVLKLSAWAARAFFEANYLTELCINWIPDLKVDEEISALNEIKKLSSPKNLSSACPFDLPKSLWIELLKRFELDPEKKVFSLTHKEWRHLIKNLRADAYLIEGKTTHKEEFVTCGGVKLSEVHFKTMESKKCKNLYFAGEILDIDGITGGFNFQNAWTTGFIAGSSATI